MMSGGDKGKQSEACSIPCFLFLSHDTGVLGVRDLSLMMQRLRPLLSLERFFQLVLLRWMGQQAAWDCRNDFERCRYQ